MAARRDSGEPICDADRGVVAAHGARVGDAGAGGVADPDPEGVNAGGGGGVPDPGLGGGPAADHKPGAAVEVPELVERAGVGAAGGGGGEGDLGQVAVGG